MKNGFIPLNVPAFGLASGIIGFIFSWLMGGMMGYQGYGMMGYGMMSGLGIGPFMSLWMSLLAGIAGGLFAWLYNALAPRFN